VGVGNGVGVAVGVGIGVEVGGGVGLGVAVATIGVAGLRGRAAGVGSVVPLSQNVIFCQSPSRWA